MAASTADVEAIGSHCQMAFCGQLDFLPFRCDSCRGTYCLDHRSETAHACKHAGEWARRRNNLSASAASSGPSTPKPNIRNHDKQCSSPECKTLIDTALTPGIHCQRCNRSYCLKHRMEEEHKCATLTPIGARPTGQGQLERGMAALDKLRAWGASKKAAAGQSQSQAQATSKPSISANVVALNALKRAAKGDEKIPVAKRIYLHVEASADTTTAKFPTGDFYYSAEWSVGRVLDAAAKSLQVQNVNNRVEGEEERLRVFHVEGGRLLEYSEKLGKLVVSGNTIVLLRGIGPPAPDLIEV
ncbi:hypothetical protein K402DRAFT_338600 [Aulographum hederae CBS 113979]|uniref:AN1-type domain-containing protein n=1 Tax=Aulographum hederae CBS 113979 TaxID=1176131 RepID=A0A6G1GR55_9PEZI|nr:hypothetical protein K402DRAFT_338600 [Aulographum hederae CBS 113979]